MLEKVNSMTQSINCFIRPLGLSLSNKQQLIHKTALVVIPILCFMSNNFSVSSLSLASLRNNIIYSNCMQQCIQTNELFLACIQDCTHPNITERGYCIRDCMVDHISR